MSSKKHIFLLAGARCLYGLVKKIRQNLQSCTEFTWLSLSIYSHWCLFFSPPFVSDFCLRLSIQCIQCKKHFLGFRNRDRAKKGKNIMGSSYKKTKMINLMLVHKQFIKALKSQSLRTKGNEACVIMNK